MSLSAEDIERVLRALDRSEWDQAEIVVGDVRIALGRGDLPLPEAGGTAPAAPPAPAPAEASAPSPAPAVPGPAPAPAAPAGTNGAGAAPAGDHVVAAPSVGVFWRAPSPGAPPFVEVGSTVRAGETIGIVEVMKLMNNVAADVSGTVTAVLRENAAQVQHGDGLVAIRADG